MALNYGNIKKTDIANGIGIRVSLFVSGCTRHCKNCFNSETWDFNYGNPFTKETEDEIIESLSKSYINGLTVLGGEPFEVRNQREILPFIKRSEKNCPIRQYGSILAVHLKMNCKKKDIGDAKLQMNFLQI